MRGTRGSLGLSVVLGIVALATGCLRDWDGYGRDLGDPCGADDECRTGLCAADASGTRVCATSCAGPTGCIPGWTCGEDGTCACPGGSEICNALDDDCDGEIDEAGVCGCGGAESCNLVDDDCDGMVDETGCGSCVPHAEGCNGVDDDCDGIVDDETGAALCRPGFECAGGTCQCSAVLHPATDELDLLFVIDNSNSMAEEQDTLTRELPLVLRALASGDRDGDGTPDFTPPRSIHLGVVTTDMGSGGFAFPTCDRGTFGSMFGDDGVLVTRGATAIAGCLATYPPVFEFSQGSTDVDQLASDLACVATLGTAGCGMEQPLEAMLKALSPSTPQEWTIPGYVPPVFFASTSGHADRENAGFVRPGSALAIVLLTDEEDCSAADPELFDPGSTRYVGELSLRCFSYPAAQHPVERFARGLDGSGGLLGLRRRPDRLVVAMITGVPLDAVPDPGSPDYDAILMHPDMQPMLDPEATTPRQRPACSVPSGIAMPARRIVRAAQLLEQGGARVSVGSICQASDLDTLSAMIDDVAEALTAPPACE